MSHEIKNEDPDAAWEDGKLGRDGDHVRRSTPEVEKAVEEAECLHMISFRLQRELIEQLKFIAAHHGIGYQPLMRDVLCRFARSEMLLIAQQMQEQLKAQAIIETAQRKQKQA